MISIYWPNFLLLWNGTVDCSIEGGCLIGTFDHCYWKPNKLTSLEAALAENSLTEWLTRVNNTFTSLLCPRMGEQWSSPIWGVGVKRVTKRSTGSNIVQVDQNILVRQWLGQNATRGNAIISVCSATPLGKHKENTEKLSRYVFDQNFRAIYQPSTRCLTDIF